jgi:hypothetical protein
MREADQWCGIVILYHEETDFSMADSVGQGIEEEGIPYRLRAWAESAVTAYSLAHEPGLGVAVEIDCGVVKVYCRQLKESSPLFVLRQGSQRDLRIIGHNAARIVKGRPFLALAE